MKDITTTNVTGNTDDLLETYISVGLAVKITADTLEATGMLRQTKNNRILLNDMMKGFNAAAEVFLEMAKSQIKKLEFVHNCERSASPSPHDEMDPERSDPDSLRLSWELPADLCLKVGAEVGSCIDLVRAIEVLLEGQKILNALDNGELMV